VLGDHADDGAFECGRERRYVLRQNQDLARRAPFADRLHRPAQVEKRHLGIDQDDVGP
jgi:hypothetical protein